MNIDMTTPPSDFEAFGRNVWTHLESAARSGDVHLSAGGRRIAKAPAHRVVNAVTTAIAADRRAVVAEDALVAAWLDRLGL